MADFIAIGLRGLAYAAALLAAGTPVFRWLFINSHMRSAPSIRVTAVSMASVGLSLTIAHAIVEPARLAGELRGVLDSSLHMTLLASNFGLATAIRAFGLAILISGSLKQSRSGEAVALFGAFLTVVSFAFMGHTSAHAQRWLLAPLLTIHLVAIAFWFGGLGPLLSVTKRETGEVAGAIVDRFSRVAIWWVPTILVAGILMTGVLLGNVSGLRTQYGFLLMAKIGGFTILMLLAAANRWRFGPKISTADHRAVRAFQNVVVVEWVLLLVIVMTTAAMTTLFSPQH